MRILRFGLAATVLIGVVLVGACSSPPTLRTQSLSEAPTIDGTLADWGGSLSRVGDESVSMSALPTDSTLYLALLIPNQAHIRAVAEHGLIVWVDPSGKQRHTYGIRYPIGLRAQRAERAVGTSASDGSQRSLTFDDLFPSDLAIIRNDTVRHRMPAGLSSEVQAQATLDTGSLIYEIAIPLPSSASGANADARQLGLRSPLGDVVAVGLETPTPDDDSDLVGESSGIPSVTGRSGRGRTPRGRRGRRRQQAPSLPSPDHPPLNLWTRIVSDNGS